MKTTNTSWGQVADWYDDLIEKEGSYQKEVILPNLLRLLDLKKGEIVLDLACGTGFFSREYFKKGAKVIGADIGSELIKLAKENSPQGIEYQISSADKLSLKNNSVDKITIVLAIQNIADAQAVFKECQRVLKPGGALFLVLNHPAFRVPKESDWGWDEENKIQYRRVDKYLSESKVKIIMHPGSNPSSHTFSFHRPLQYYFKSLSKNNFCVHRLEEWVSNKKTAAGPRAVAENRSRAEIPLFLFMEAIKNS